MRSKILPTLYSIVHGPRNKRNNKNMFMTKKTKRQSTCKNPNKQAFRFKIHTLVYTKTCIQSQIYKNFIHTYKYYKTQIEY